jgi:SNF2 family DNA or RNA helicase
MVEHYRYKTKPYEHQLEALERSYNKTAFAYFMEMGTGKSKVLVDNISMLYDNGEINGALIIAPKGVYRNWISQEIPNHLASHIKPISVLWDPSTSAKKQKELNQVFKPGFDLHILVMNVEAFSTKKGVEFASRFLNCHKTMMAIDESTTIKNPKAQRTKAIIGLSSYAKYRRILTGSPVTKSPLDLYMQCNFLDPELLGFSSYYAFRSRYAELMNARFGGFRVQIVKHYKNLEELSMKLEPFSYRVLKEDCLDLPEKIYQKRYVELTPEQTKLYATMKQMALAELNGKKATAPHVLTQMMRLNQIICGHFKDDNDEVQEVKSNRVKDLLSILDETEGKAIIWANYIYDVEQIQKAIAKEFGEKSVVTYYGKTHTDDRQEAIERFQNDDECRFFIGNPQTGGYGITLTAANTVIYYSNGYDLEKRLQSEDRAHRIGQKKSVTYIDMIAEKTVDEKIVKALRKKIDIASEVLGEELKEWI